MWSRLFFDSRISTPLAPPQLFPPFARHFSSSLPVPLHLFLSFSLPRILSYFPEMCDSYGVLRLDLISTDTILTDSMGEDGEVTYRGESLTETETEIDFISWSG